MAMFSRISMTLTAVLLASSAHAATGRLPDGVTPVAYDIFVDPDAQKLTFTGRETITINVTKPTATITLNAADISFKSVTLDGRITASVAVDAAQQRATFTFAAPVTAGRHTLAIDYAGKIYQSAAGMFVIDYTNPDGSADRMLLTQFEAPDARRFAPMWDEPAFKAPFTLSSTAPNGQLAFSNMPVASKEAGSAGKTIWHFRQTPKMSSYLLFLGMGNLERKTAMAGNVEIGIITRKGVSDQGDYALASAKRILAYYNNYFGTPYPLPKLDMIAGPGSSQFFSAMENWGAILYFERALLLDPKLQTENQRQNVFGTVAHEMAHQWFGDLVTMKWWDDLWLNEGYASWMASKVAGDLNPSWDEAAQAVAGSRQAAFALDSRATTHPIVQHVETVDEISQAFDGITYSKGAAVIGMLEGAVGADTFRSGVRRYMAKYKYSNTETDQLWAEVSAAAGRNVKPMMDSFTRQGGVPLINVAAPECVGGATRLGLSQGRYGMDAASKQPRTWIVPLNIGTVGAGGTGKGIRNVTVSGPTTKFVTIPGCAVPVVNAGQSSYTRVQYTPQHFDALRRNFDKLALTDQLGLITDTAALAAGNYQSIDPSLALIDTVRPDASPLVWETIAGQMAAFDALLKGAPEQAAFRAKAVKILRPVFDRVGWTPRPTDDPLTLQLREAIIPVLGSFGDPQIVAEAQRLALQSFTDPGSVTGSTRAAALSITAINMTPEQWDMLHERAKAEKSPVAKSQLYTLLGAAKNPELAKRALALALTDEPTVPMRPNIIKAVAAQHPDMAFDWGIANEAAVNSFLEASSRTGFLVGLGAASSDPAMADKALALAERLGPGSKRIGQIVANGIRTRAELRARYAGPIAAWAAR